MIPRVKQQHFRIPLDQAVIAAMMPTIMSTSEAIKSYQPERRQCFFPSERSLKYFKIYTQQNCQIECKTNFTMQMCGCVDFYMPRNHTDSVFI
jgi:amiloride-sensitive sodium channel